MTFTAKYTYTPEQWAEARRLRAEGLSYGAIAEKAGFHTVSTLHRRARKERWATSLSTNAGRPKNPKSKRRPSPITADICRALALRLYSILDLRIRTMELCMKKRLDAYETAAPGAEPPVATKDERESFAALIENINQVTEIASEPASAADGGRKSATNPDLTALSEEIDAAGLALASEKDALRRDIAERLAKLFPPE